MNAAAAKAGALAVVASPLDDMAVTAILGRTFAAELGPVILAVSLAAGLAVWWWSR